VTLRDGVWSGESCFIVGGGPSLRPLAAKRLQWVGDSEGQRCIVLNRAVEFVNYPDVWLAVDSVFWRRQKGGAYGTPRVWVDTGDKRPDVDVILPCAAPTSAPNRHSAYAWGQTLAEGVGCGGNSGFAALNLADILGADPIYLLGFDMRGEGGKVTHFHDGYTEKAPSDVLCDRWLESFRWAASRVRARVVVLEVEPGDSRLDCFPKQLASEVL